MLSLDGCSELLGSLLELLFNLDAVLSRISQAWFHTEAVWHDFGINCIVCVADYWSWTVLAEASPCSHINTRLILNFDMDRVDCLILTSIQCCLVGYCVSLRGGTHSTIHCIVHQATSFVEVTSGHIVLNTVTMTTG